MKAFQGIFPTVVLLLSIAATLKGQKTDINGQLAGWITGSNSDRTYLQAGVRFVPQVTFSYPVLKKYKIDGEFSADGYSNYTLQSDSGGVYDGKLRIYRAWVRFSANRFELRAGLQKINFGSASILRPLMWFDRVDPRDPLKLTSGVTGLQARYYFRNNANIWGWLLAGNKNTKGWETIPSDAYRPEFGGRVQLPFPRGELAFSYHNREARYPDGSSALSSGKGYFNENRFGFDTKADLGIGLWLEGTITHRNDLYNPSDNYEKALTLGADYNIGIGQGLDVMFENMFVNVSGSFSGKGNSLTMSGLSLTLPVSIITRANVIVFYDWKDKGWYNFADVSFTFNKISINLIAFDNPRSFSLLNFSAGQNLFAGYGGQVMLVYNF